jgi:hypothetical protein
MIHAPPWSGSAAGKPEIAIRGWDRGSALVEKPWIFSRWILFLEKSGLR